MRRCKILTMIRTQVQLPETLYRDLKRLATSREWSLAETLRRAAEQCLVRHPPAPDLNWQPPVSDAVGWRGLNHEDVRRALFSDREPPAARKC